VSDEDLRALEREVALSGTPPARLRLAAELERRGQREDAVTALFQALAVAPGDEGVRLALGKFRGPAPGQWCLPQGDARNTRRSVAKGPRGEGRVVSRQPLAPLEAAQFNAMQDQRVDTHDTVPPPLIVGSYAYYSLPTGRRQLAATADGHVIAQNYGASGFEWSANRDGVAVWRISMLIAGENEGNFDWWSQPHAVIGPDATVYGNTSLRKLIAIEPTGERRFEHAIDGKVNSLALDHERGRLHVLLAHPAGLSTHDLKTGERVSWVGLEKIIVASEAVVCDDGRVACISPLGYFAIVDDSGRLQDYRYTDADTISGGYGALSPWGELIVVSFDPRGATVASFDITTGAKRTRFEAPDCRGAPAIDSQGTIYLDGGARYVMGYNLVTGQPCYHVDRASLWRAPDQPSSQFALREGEIAFIEVTSDGVTLLRVGA